MNKSKIPNILVSTMEILKTKTKYSSEERPERKRTFFITMEYDMKSYQVNKDIANCTDVQLNLFKNKSSTKETLL